MSHISPSIIWLVSKASLLLVLLFCSECFAQSQLQPIIELSQANVDSKQWLNTIATRKRDQHFYLYSKNGHITELESDNALKQSLLVVPDFYPEMISLQALALHPNFALSQQQGYQTFYTAHIEPQAPQLRHSRLTDKTLNSEFRNDIVIVEWQLSSANASRVDDSKKREVIRIATNRDDNVVHQIGFNPYIKSWHENFGFLFIALSSEGNSSSPLHSGAILRINPKPFGLRQYTAPNSNPFIGDENLTDEMLAFGLGDVTSIHWLKRHQHQLLVSHTKQSQQISRVNFGDNLLETTPKSSYALPSDEQLNSKAILIYRGSQFKDLRNKLLLFIKKTNTWYVKALNSQALTTTDDVDYLSTIAANLSEPFTVFTDPHDELLLLNQKDKIIYQFNQTASTKQATSADKRSTAVEVKSDNRPIVITSAVLIILALTAVFLVRKRSRFSTVNGFLNKNYVKAELDESTETLLLFHRHETKPSCKIKLADIKTFSLLLNDRKLLSIEKDNSGYDIEKEKQLHTQLNAEKRIKMIDERVRKLELFIEAIDGITAIIELYLRQGNHRFTKLKFGNVIDEITNWLWIVGQTIAPQHTKQRPIKAPIPPIPTVTRQEKPSKSPSNDVKPNNTVASSQPAKAEKLEDNNIKLTDTRLIDALDKLAKLKAQGFLTEQEFDLAKARVLRDLSLHNE